MEARSFGVSILGCVEIKGHRCIYRKIIGLAILGKINQDLLPQRTVDIDYILTN